MTIKSMELNHLYDELWQAETNEHKAKAEAIKQKIEEINGFME